MLIQRLFPQIHSQAGDTLVEVLIAILVITLVLTGAYASTNQNVTTTEDTQEHAQALQLVQGQIEFLRADAATGVTSLPVCYKSDGSRATTPSTDCNVDRSGNGGCTTEPCYTLAISGNLGSVDQISAHWPSLLSGETDSVVIYYEQ